MILDSDGYPMEYAVFVPMMLIDESEPSIEMRIDKAGGGTLGVFYANGSWSYAVSVDGEILWVMTCTRAWGSRMRTWRASWLVSSRILTTLRA